MKEIKSVEPVSVAKITAIISAIWAFVVVTVGLLFTPLIMMGPFHGYVTLFGLAAIVIYPMLAAIMGFIGGLVGAFFYNVAAKYTGGVRLDI